VGQIPITYVLMRNNLKRHWLIEIIAARKTIDSLKIKGPSWFYCLFHSQDKIDTKWLSAKRRAIDVAKQMVKDCGRKK